MLAPLLVSGSKSFIHLRVWAVYIWGYEPFSLYTWFCKNPIPRWASWNQSWHNWAIYNFQNYSCRVPHVTTWNLWILLGSLRGFQLRQNTQITVCLDWGLYIGGSMGNEKISQMALEAANHRFPDTNLPHLFDKFQWKVDLEWRHRPRFISCWLYAQTSFVSLICQSSLRCPEKSLAFDKLHRLQHCIHHSIGRWGELPRPHSRDYQKSSDQPTFQAFTWHLSMIKMIHRDLLSSRPMFTTTICGSMTLSWWGVLSHGCGRGMLITL